MSNEPITRYLIEKEADLNALNEDRGPPLTYSRKVETARLLIEKGANIDIDIPNDGVLGWLLNLRRKEVAEFLLDVGAELPDIESPGALNLLRNAISCGSLKCFDKFIQKGFDPLHESDA